MLPEINSGEFVGEPEIIECPVDDMKLKEMTNAKELFDCVAEFVAKFIEKEGITDRLPLGFTFSFPVKNSSLNSGKLLRWTKDFKAEDAVRQDPVQLLQKAFERKNVSMPVNSHVWIEHHTD